MKQLITIFFTAVLTTSCGTDSNRHQQTIFDKDKWLIGDRRTRGNMVDNIVSDSIFIGTSKIQAIILLGQPDDSTDNGKRFYYDIDIGKKTGPLGLGGTWLFQLNVDFDTTDNIVRQVWIAD